MPVPDVRRSRTRACRAVLLAAAGLVVWVPERRAIWMLVTALSGSGPAYFFRLAQLMAEAGAAMGLDPAWRGSSPPRRWPARASWWPRKTSPDLARMSAEVASKGGTTEAALNRFAALGLDRLVAAAMQAAAERSRELADQFGDG